MRNRYSSDPDLDLEQNVWLDDKEGLDDNNNNKDITKVTNQYHRNQHQTLYKDASHRQPLLSQSPPMIKAIQQNGNLEESATTRNTLTQRRKQLKAEQITKTTSTPLPSSSNIPLTLMDQIVLLGIKDKSGQLSLLNDSLSYVLRGCCILELAFRKRLSITYTIPKKPNGVLLTINDERTGEILLDETLKYIKMEQHSVAGWMDLLSGETWNPAKVTFQLRQVRERVSKGLVDKGILRTSKQSILSLWEMASHPLADSLAKSQLVQHIISVVTTIFTSTSLNPSIVTSEHLRDIALVCSAYAAGVLEQAVSSTKYSSGRDREVAIKRAQQWLREYSIRDDFLTLSTTKTFKQERTLDADTSLKCIVSDVLAIFCRLDNIL